ncbi:MAG: hypothetical protein ACE5LS_02875 [Thermoplasmata archaeon]
MMDRYGRAVVEERTQPQNLAELRNYLRMEFGLGTEPGYLLKREAAERARRPPNGVRRALTRAFRALVKVVGAQSSSNGRRPGGGSTSHAR